MTRSKKGLTDSEFAFLSHVITQAVLHLSMLADRYDIDEETKVRFREIQKMYSKMDDVITGSEDYKYYVLHPTGLTPNDALKYLNFYLTKIDTFLNDHMYNDFTIAVLTALITRKNADEYLRLYFENYGRFDVSLINRFDDISDTPAIYINYVMINAFYRLFQAYMQYSHPDDEEYYDLFKTSLAQVKKLKTITDRNMKRNNGYLYGRNKPSKRDIASLVDKFMRTYSSIIYFPPNRFTVKTIQSFITGENDKEALAEYLSEYERWVPDRYLARTTKKESADRDDLPNEFTKSNYVFTWRSNDGKRAFAGRMDQEQCRFREYNEKTKKWHRCKHKTVFGIGFCNQHLKKWYRLIIADAEDVHGNSIGKGVYPYGNKGEVVFRKGEPIAWYRGEYVTDDELQNRYDDYTGPYAVNDSEDRPMDGALRRGVGALMNQGSRGENNAVIGRMPDESGERETYGIIATRDIVASGAKTETALMKLKREDRNEILVDYRPGDDNSESSYRMNDSRHLSFSYKNKKYLDRMKKNLPLYDRSTIDELFPEHR